MNPNKNYSIYYLSNIIKTAKTDKFINICVEKNNIEGLRTLHGNNDSHIITNETLRIAEKNKNIEIINFVKEKICTTKH